MDNEINAVGSAATNVGMTGTSAAPAAPTDKSKQAFEMAMSQAMNRPAVLAGGGGEDDDNDDGSTLNVSMANCPIAI